MSKVTNLSSVKKKKRAILVIVLITLVFIAILGSSSAFVPLKNGKPLLFGGSFTESPPSSSPSSKSDDETLQTKIQVLIDAGDSKKAEQIIKNDPKFDTDWYNYSLLADVYLNSNQSDKALETLLNLEKKFGIEQYTTAVRIAELYLESGNKEQAIRYYRLAIELVRSSDTPTREWDIDQLEQRIGEIE